MKIRKYDECVPGLGFHYIDLGPFTIWRDSFTFKITKRVFWNVNFSWPGIGTDNLMVGEPVINGVKFGPGKRFEFTFFPFGHWLISLDHQRFTKWTFRDGYRHDKIGRMTWSPPRWARCKTLTKKTACSECGGWRWHRCLYKQ